FNSQSQAEKNHIIGAFRFELTKVGVQAIRERVISMLANASMELAEAVAAGIGIAVPPNQQRALETPAVPEVTMSPALSLLARPGDGSIKGRKVALLVADGIDGASLREVHAALARAGAVPRFIGARLGRVQPSAGAAIDVEATLETAPSVLWDAVVVPGQDAALGGYGQAKEFLKDQYRHCKTIVCLGGTSALIDAAALPPTLPDGSADPGLLLMPNAEEAAATLITLLAGPRHVARETDPPRV
ncbi:MAG: catalase-related domain-containing protein, partial [Caldimonas sp.]